jgi:hypothetical protein
MPSVIRRSPAVARPPLQVAVLCVLAALAAPTAGAAGIGGNFTYGWSDGRVKDTGDFFPDIQTSADLYEIGLSFDTNLARDRLVNYRVNANLQIVEQKLNQGPGKAQIDGVGFALNQLIGFGFIRTPRIRAFIGPTIHLGVAGFDDHETVQGVRSEFEEALFTAAIGPEIGLNYNVGRHLTVSLTGYYRFGVQAQFYDSPFETSSSSDRTFDGREHRVGLTTAIFFRFGGDRYEKRAPRSRKKRASRAADTAAR